MDYRRFNPPTGLFILEKLLRRWFRDSKSRRVVTATFYLSYVTVVHITLLSYHLPSGNALSLSVNAPVHRRPRLGGPVMTTVVSAARSARSCHHGPFNQVPSPVAIARHHLDILHHRHLFEKQAGPPTTKPIYTSQSQPIPAPDVLRYRCQALTPSRSRLNFKPFNELCA